MYARGMSTREIVGHLRDLYGIDVSPDLISAVTDAVLEEVAAWQARPLETVYPLIFFDALRVKIRDEGMVRNKAVPIALGVRADGSKEILGLWLEQNEGAKFWLRVMNELKNRGVEDVLIAVVDGLKGFPEAIAAVFPEATVQTCIDLRSEEHTSELQSRQYLVCRLLLEKKKTNLIHLHPLINILQPKHNCYAVINSIPLSLLVTF